MKEIINKKKASTNPIFMVSNNCKITDSNDIASGFNDFFINVGESLAKKIPQVNRSAMSYLTHTFSKSLFLSPVNKNEMIFIIKQLKSNSSAGWDDVSSKVLQYCHLPLLDPLIHLVNLSLAQGVFPDLCKIAKVIPLFKSGINTVFTNYLIN